MRNAALHGNIQSYCINFSNTELVERFAKKLNERGISPHTVYGSNLNVCYLHDSVSMEKFCTAMQVLSMSSQSDVHMLTCEYRLKEDCSYTKRVLTLQTSNQYVMPSQTPCKKAQVHLKRLIEINRMKFHQLIAARFMIGIDFTEFRRLIHDYKHQDFYKELNKGVRIYAAQGNLSPHDAAIFEHIFVDTYRELCDPKITVCQFSKNLRKRFPDLASEYDQASIETRSFMFDSSYIVEKALLQIYRSLSLI